MAQYLTTQIPGVIPIGTFFKPPKPPIGEASWLSQPISQPYFPIFDINLLPSPIFNKVPPVVVPTSLIPIITSGVVPQPIIGNTIRMF